MEVIHTILVIYPALWWGSIVTLAGAQTMIVNEYNKLVLRGEDVTLKCYFPVKIRLSNCQWYFTQNEGVEKNLANGTRYTWSCSFTDANYVHIQLSFKNATFSDTGKYTCEAITATATVKEELQLNVYAKPEITVHKTYYKAVSGTNVTLECVVIPNGETNISTGWQNMFHQQWNNLTKSNKYFWTTQMPSLVISEVTTTVSGFYRCFASTPFVTVEGLQISLKVQDLPLVTVQQTQFFITAGKDVVLNCIVNGSGMAVSVKWYRQSHAFLSPLPNSIKYGWRQSGPDASIRISKVTENDTGIYVCEGTTEVGSSKGNNIELRMGYKPTVWINEYNYSIGMGDNLTLHCSIDGHGSAIKGVEWLKQENSQYRYLQSSTRVFWDISNPSLKIINISLDDAGNYTCRGVTELGTSDSRHISVQVFYLPVINQPDKEDQTGSSLEKYVVPGVSVVACVALIALIVVVILIRRKHLKERTDKPKSGIRSTNGQQQPSLSENICSGNDHAKFYVNLSEDMTYAQVIRKSNKNIDGDKSSGDTKISQSNTHIDGSNYTRETDTSQVYMNINNTYAAVQHRSSTSHSNSNIHEETESENTQVKRNEQLNYAELEFGSNAQDENSSLVIRGSPSNTTYTDVVVFTR